MFTYPVLEGQDIGRTALVEHDIEDDHKQYRQVEARDGRNRMEVSKSNEHPGGKYQNPRNAAQGDSH